MTTSAPSPGPVDSPTRVRITDPADLIAAVPALLGFVPTNSVVLICIGGPSGGGVGTVMRHDLVLPNWYEPDRAETDPAMSAALERFAAVCDAENASKALVVIVDDCTDVHIAVPVSGAADWHDREEIEGIVRRWMHEDIVDELAYLLDACGTKLIGAHVVSQIEAGAQWWSLGTDPRRGVLPDPNASFVAAAHVFEGHQIRRSRADIAAQLDPVDSRETALVADHLDKVLDSTVLAMELAVQRADPLSYARRQLELVLRQIANLESGARLLAPEIAELGAALTNTSVRDALLALSVGDAAEAAERMFLLLTRSLPGTARAAAATLLAMCAYIRGDGPLAGVSLEAALTADPEYRLARMLDQALQLGMRPAVIRETAVAGFAAADALGVRLPPEC
ncbi:DUF4192 domain-containing protein [Skermania sp. ID1734]|uniref:DUF4192 domain-containing protein n=1 Tax=Skermania sp. ID1734 TaxID=2597516 RepID=UPI00117EBE06|nr:DUF4192 domain-containing protein [Skermania sp. ID1734]TSD96046.1 DUF4192 domain-containing protein [Skermania sp. ID1734]